MIIYQSNYSSVILPTSASLLISSVPLSILNDEMEKLFLWMAKNMTLTGVAIVDMPAHPMDYKSAVKAAAAKTGWRYVWDKRFRDFYQRGDCQMFSAFTRSDIPIPVPEKVGYSPCFTRVMTHRCEFDSHLIRELIELYSEPMDAVLDPFCGTGIVPRTARDIGRQAIGIDTRCPFTNRLVDNANGADTSTQQVKSVDVSLRKAD